MARPDWPGVFRLLLSVQGRRFSGLPLTHTRCNFGGRRAWFQCPTCSRRVGKLYLRIHEGTVVCRSCGRLAYPSENESYRERLRRKARKIRTRLRWEEWEEVPEKPVGMHWDTYTKLVHSAVSAERLAALYERVRGFRSVPRSRLPLGLQVMRALLPRNRVEWQQFWRDRRRVKRREFARLVRKTQRARAEVDPSWFEDPPLIRS